MFFINICYTVITYRIKDRMEAVPVIILERRPVIRNGGIEVGMDRTKYWLWMTKAECASW